MALRVRVPGAHDVPALGRWCARIGSGRVERILWWMVWQGRDVPFGQADGLGNPGRGASPGGAVSINFPRHDGSGAGLGWALHVGAFEQSIRDGACLFFPWRGILSVPEIGGGKGEERGGSYRRFL